MATKTVKGISTAVSAAPEESPVKQIEVKSTDLVARAAALEIIGDDEYRAAGGYQVDLKAMAKEIGAVFDPIVKAAHAAWEQARLARSKYLDPVNEQVAAIQKRMGKYVADCERQRQEEQRIMEAKERERVQNEAKQTAEFFENTDEPQAAAAVLAGADRAAAQAAAAVRVESSVPKFAGTATRKSYKYEIIDPNLVPDMFWKIDEVALGAFVRSKGMAANIPGVKVTEDIIVSTVNRAKY